MPVRPRLALLVAVLPLLAGCGSAPQQIDPSGVDGLHVPTPSPDPADFVARVDQPLLPLRPGSRWRYEAPPGGPRGAFVVVRVVGFRTIDGVRATAVVSRRRDDAGRTGEPETRWYAEDVDGNVWLLGRRTTQGEWMAGRGGARAGLAMPAVPRRGDGFTDGEAPGVGDRLTVVAVDTELPGSLAGRGLPEDGLVLLERRTRQQPGVLWREYYAPRVGLVARERSGAGATGELLLTDHTGPG